MICSKQESLQNMNNRKPLPLLPQPVREICPVCGKASYSKNGIHPQCAITQADAQEKDILLQRRKPYARRRQLEN